ncbi:MAG: hypothetical protein AB7P18_35205 [Candidatus Binatia bacterium]
MHFLTWGVSVVLLLVASPCWAQGQLENPAPDSKQSGVGLISGWFCTATIIEAVIDNRVTVQTSYGTARSDTQGVCGDTNNGFGLLVNWNDVGDGSHTLHMLADGKEFARVTFTVATLGASFLRGLTGTWTVPHFPRSDVDTVVTWQEGIQGFTIAGVVPSDASSPLTGQWYGRVFSAIPFALSDVECSDADVSFTVNGSRLSGTVATDSGIYLTLSGVMSSDGVLGGQARRGGEFFAVFSGSVEGDTVTGQWTDVFGCWGMFELQKP